MKGLPGVVIAAALGIIGAFCNWFYISNEAKNYEKVSFVAISGEADVKRGDHFSLDDFVRVDVPKTYVGELDKTAVHWKDRDTATVYRATKSYRNGEVLFWHDLKGVAQLDLTEGLRKDEDVLFQVVVDAATFIPGHYDPGDEVEFFVPQLVGSGNTGGSSPNPGAGSTKTVGKFRILALGERKEKQETAAAYKRRPVRENVVTIGLKFPFDAKAEELFKLISAAGGRGVRMIKHKPELGTSGK